MRLLWVVLISLLIDLSDTRAHSGNGHSKKKCKTEGGCVHHQTRDGLEDFNLDGVTKWSTYLKPADPQRAFTKDDEGARTSDHGRGGTHFFPVERSPMYHYYTQSAYLAMQSELGDESSSELAETQIGNETVAVETANEPEIMEIADPSRPIIGGEIAYFWDPHYMPSGDSNGKNIKAANGNFTISFYRVDKLVKCWSSASQLNRFHADRVFLPDGTSPTRIAWFCSRGETCKYWQCEATKIDWEMFLLGLVIPGTVVSCMCVGSCCAICGVRNCISIPKRICGWCADRVGSFCSKIRNIRNKCARRKREEDEEMEELPSPGSTPPPKLTWKQKLNPSRWFKK